MLFSAFLYSVAYIKRNLLDGKRRIKHVEEFKSVQCLTTIECLLLNASIPHPLSVYSMRSFIQNRI